MAMRSDELRLLANLQAGFGVEESAADARVSPARAASIIKRFARDRIYRDGKVTPRGMRITCEQPAADPVRAYLAGTQAVSEETIPEAEYAVDIDDDPTDVITDEELDQVGSDHADIQGHGGSNVEDRPDVR